MYKSKIGRLIVAFAVSSAAYGESQAQNGAGSVYSIFGIGEMSRATSVAAHGMGNTSIGLSSPYQINIVNPAANDQAGAYYNHVFDLGFYYANTTYESQGLQENGSYGGLSNFSFWFKYNDHWNGLIGLSSYSNVGYNIYKSNVNSFQTGDYDIAYEGAGGLNEFYFSNSYSLFSNFSVGLKMAFIFGNISHTEDVSSNQTLKRYLVENSTSIRNLDLEYSLNYRWERPDYFLNFGLIYNHPTKLNENTTASIAEWDYSLGAAINEESLYGEEITSDYSLPRRVGFGVSYNTDKVILSGDIEFNQWSQASVENYTNDLEDTWRYAVGMEITPNRYGESGLGRISYRVGGYHENAYIKINDKISNTYGFTAGLGVPIKRGSLMNVAYQRKFTGTTDNELILESTHELTLSFSIRQRWFQRHKYN